MWVFQLLHHLYVIELDIEILIDGAESAFYLDIVLQFDGNFVINLFEISLLLLSDWEAELFTRVLKKLFVDDRC